VLPILWQSGDDPGRKFPNFGYKQDMKVFKKKKGSLLVTS
jgi:hypothetical protein